MISIYEKDIMDMISCEVVSIRDWKDLGILGIMKKYNIQRRCNVYAYMCSHNIKRCPYSGDLKGPLYFSDISREEWLLLTPNEICKKYNFDISKLLKYAKWNNIEITYNSNIKDIDINKYSELYKNDCLKLIELCKKNQFENSEKVINILQNSINTVEKIL